jgi:hypothetical protein
VYNGRNKLACLYTLVVCKWIFCEHTVQPASLFVQFRFGTLPWHYTSWFFLPVFFMNVFFRTGKTIKQYMKYQLKQQSLHSLPISECLSLAGRHFSQHWGGRRIGVENDSNCELTMRSKDVDCSFPHQVEGWIHLLTVNATKSLTMTNSLEGVLPWI